MFESNVIGTLQVTQALLPALSRRARARSSTSGRSRGTVAYEGGSGYVAAKHAVAALTETLRLELVDQPVRVEEIAPGMVRTEEFALTRFGGDQERADAVYAGVSEPLVAAGHRRGDRLDGRSDRPTSTSTCWSSSPASRPPRTRCTATADAARAAPGPPGATARPHRRRTTQARATATCLPAGAVTVCRSPVAARPLPPVDGDVIGCHAATHGRLGRPAAARRRAGRRSIAVSSALAHSMRPSGRVEAQGEEGAGARRHDAASPSPSGRPSRDSRTGCGGR